VLARPSVTIVTNGLYRERPRASNRRPSGVCVHLVYINRHEHFLNAGRCVYKLFRFREHLQSREGQYLPIMNYHPRQHLIRV
jgi:hypothetical protein